MVSVTAYSGLSVAPSRPTSAPTAASAHDRPQTGTRRNASVVITLSAEALIHVASLPKAPSVFAQLFPTREGASADALAEAVTNPGAETSSAGKSFPQVAVDARARMDAEYAAMTESGKPFDYDSHEGRDWYTAMGDLDRRSLFAVVSNEGGLFSKQEQDIARSIMSQQQGLAMGLYGGPTRLSGAFPDPFADDHAARMKAAVVFLDQVSAEEKTSFAWAEQRAATQFNYEIITRENGGVPENLDSTSPLVGMIKAALESWRALNDPAKPLDEMPLYQDAKTLHAGQVLHTGQRTASVNLSV